MEMGLSGKLEKHYSAHEEYIHELHSKIGHLGGERKFFCGCLQTVGSSKPQEMVKISN